MSNQLSDEAIARHLADAESGLMGTGHGSEPSNLDIVSMAREIQQRRSAATERIVEHAARGAAALERIAEALEEIVAMTAER